MWFVSRVSFLLSLQFDRKTSGFTVHQLNSSIRHPERCAELPNIPFRRQSIHHRSANRSIVGWRCGATVGCWTCYQEVVGSIPESGRNCVTTVGKSLTPACLDADSLHYYMESLNGYLYLSIVDVLFRTSSIHLLVCGPNPPLCVKAVNLGENCYSNWENEFFTRDCFFIGTPCTA